MNIETSSVTSSVTRLTRLNIHHARLKQRQILEKSSQSSNWTHNGNLSPNLQPPSPPIFSSNHTPIISLPSTFGDSYILIEQLEASNLYRTINKSTLREYFCKIVPTKSYHEFVSGHLRMDGFSGINTIEEVIIGKTQTYILFSPSYGDLHLYVRNKKRLRESEAIHLFRQIVSIVVECHNNGIILRDLKLRKFVFTDKEKTEIKLETLEDAVILNDIDDDRLTDKHGCPAYVSPEILSTSNGYYSGKSADCWSLGVILYTMLVGRYPFHDTDPSALFSKIRRGTFVIPDTLTAHAKCLIRSLLRREPNERLSAEEILTHRWFKTISSQNNNCNNKYLSVIIPGQMPLPMSLMSTSDSKAVSDQTVPDLSTSDDRSFLIMHGSLSSLS